MTQTFDPLVEEYDQLVKAWALVRKKMRINSLQSDWLFQSAGFDPRLPLCPTKHSQIYDEIVSIRNLRPDNNRKEWKLQKRIRKFLQE